MMLGAPQAKVDTVMHLAHSTLFCGHMGFKTPLKNTSKAHQALLTPLPISVQFERLGIDLTRPLPKSTKGHKYILVIVYYATC